MVKMVLTVPRGYDAVKLLNVASELYRGRYGGEYDIDLGDFANKRLERVENFDAYEVDGELVDFRMVEILDELQTLCPQVGKYFEQDGAGETYASASARFKDIGDGYREHCVIEVLEGDIEDRALSGLYRDGWESVAKAALG